MTDELNRAYAEIDALRATIDQLRATASRLVQAEALFHGVLESAPDAIIIVDSAGQIAMVNAQTEALFDYPRNALIGQPVELLIPTHLAGLHHQYPTDSTTDVHTPPKGAGIDLVARRRDGSEFSIEISLSPL
ncbi:MAG: PAS domain S-box protein, partial [Herpetosiphonaceae bacterium]|nr:PAS domain S-box protein [Herpetosiphonaceae bacterium]